MVGQPGAEDWDRGNGAGQSDGQGTVQTARIESNVWDTCGQRCRAVNTQALFTYFKSLSVLNC